MAESEPTESIIRRSPFHPPKEKHGEGKWVVEERHVEKRYPLSWRWVPLADLNLPPEPPPEPGIRYSRTGSGALIVPPEVPLSLHKPKDVGTPRWQEQQEKNG